MTSNWDDEHCNIGLHYDLHANRNDTELGTRVGDNLEQLLKELDIDFVQTDCKGHSGYLSWFSKLPGSSIPDGLNYDALKGWRKAAKNIGIPLYCHYSGIWDAAAAEKFPEWRVVIPANNDVKIKQNDGVPFGELMCVRSDYVDKLLLPQFFELIETYGVDGFWLDGELWASSPCYCPKCQSAFREATGKEHIPTNEDDKDWPIYWKFMLDSFNAYVTHYCDEIHKRYPHISVCSNWLQTYRNPGAPLVPIDRISGDNTYIWGLDVARCDSRFLSTRGKPWDIMVWNFLTNNGFRRKDAPFQVKPSVMVEQEVAVFLTFGGNVQIYETVAPLRDGRLVPWRIRQLKEVISFIRKRLKLCKNAESIPQVAVLHSETHFYKNVKGISLMYGGNTRPVNGAVQLGLENHFHIDLLDEWALLPRLDEFPVIIAAEQHDMSEEICNKLKRYVEQGGRLLITGAESFERFGAQFIGAETVNVENSCVFYIPAGEGASPLYSDKWRLLRPAAAKVLGNLYSLDRAGDDDTGYPAATLNQVGKGFVAYIPAAIAQDFDYGHAIGSRIFFGEVLRTLAGDMMLQVSAPTCVDVALRQQGKRVMVHLVNRASGIPNLPNQGMVDEIPAVGPVFIQLRIKSKPVSVQAAWDGGDVDWSYDGEKIHAKVTAIHIHEAIVIET